MKYLGLLAVAFFCTLQTFGQQDYFMYLQTGDNQAFYVRFHGKVYSSTGSGYLILSKLPDSTTQLTIGFPKNIFPEQHFDVPVDHRDAGYLLKNFGEKGWGLFNLQTAAVLMSSNPPEEKKSPDLTITRRTDAFSLLLANAVNDSAVLYVQTKAVRPAEIAPKKDSIAPAIIVKSGEEGKKAETNDSASAVKTISAPPKKDSAATIVKNHPIKKDTAFAVIKKPSTTKDSSLTALRGKQAFHNSKPAGRDTAAAIVRNKPVKKDNTTTVAAAKKPLGLFKRAPKERKDTIIMMSGGKPIASKPAMIKKQTPDSFYAVKPKPAVQKESVVSVQKQQPAVQTSNDSSKAVVNSKPGTKPDVITETVVPTATKQERADTQAVIKASMQSENSKDSGVANVTSPGEPTSRPRQLVNKAAEVFTDTSYVAVFVDQSQEKFDTIRLSIPFFEAMRTPSSAQAGGLTKTDTVVPARKVIDSINTTVIAKTDSSKPSLLPAADTGRKIDTTVMNLSTVVVPSATKDSGATPQDSGTVSKRLPASAALVNPNCKEIAADNDIDKLRVKMLLMLNDEERTALAKKLFQQRCVLTRQVRALSELFKTDEAKYKWFDAAYPYVSDLSNFPALGELINDSYYLNRFKAMLRN